MDSDANVTLDFAVDCMMDLVEMYKSRCNMKEYLVRQIANKGTDRESLECQPGARWRWRWRCARRLQASPRQKLDFPSLYQL